MKKIFLFSLFLLIGLVLSQALPAILLPHAFEMTAHAIKLLTTAMLAFIMIRVGYEFDLDKTRLRSYGWDYIVAATAATIPWILVALYFVFIIPASDGTGLWQKALVTSRFASPTSAGVLFSMLGAAGLTGTWMYKKIKILAIFDDLDTVLLMIPLQMMLVGMRWQLIVVLVPMALLLAAAWRYLHKIRLPVTWPWVLGYGVVITLISEAIYHSSRLIDEVVPIHIETLLPAFVLGCVMAHQSIPPHSNKRAMDIIDKSSEKLVMVIISSVFLAFVGLSMPPVINIAGPAGAVQQVDKEMAEAYVISESSLMPKTTTPNNEVVTDGVKGGEINWPMIALHVLMVTIISNLGKLFPFFCYKKEALWKERLALAVGMFPRGEVGAGVLIISIAYGIGGVMVTVAMLSLALNLLLTGLFIIAVKKLLGSSGTLTEPAP